MSSRDTRLQTSLSLSQLPPESDSDFDDVLTKLEECFVSQNEGARFHQGTGTRQRTLFVHRLTCRNTG